MLESFKNAWAELQKGTPGRRFQDRSRKHRKTAGAWDRNRILKLVLGISVIVPGIIMIPFPGPGAIIVILGMALISDEIPGVAKALDWLELRFRSLYKKIWGDVSRTGRIWIAICALIVIIAALYGIYIAYERGHISLPTHFLKKPT